MNPLGLSTKLALIFGGLLLVSMSGNVWLARHMWMGQQKDADAAVLAKTAAERDGLRQAAAVNTAIAGAKALDTTALLSRLDAIADRGEQVRTVYRAAAARAPLAASCAPGVARVDAVNEGLGPTQFSTSEQHRGSDGRAPGKGGTR